MKRLSPIKRLAAALAIGAAAFTGFGLTSVVTAPAAEAASTYHYKIYVSQVTNVYDAQRKCSTLYRGWLTGTMPFPLIYTDSFGRKYYDCYAIR